jgi:RNA polymerase sigma-70 factor (ECF subfamily)
MLEREALERFVDEFGDHAYGFAFSLCGNQEDAKELVQKAFVKIFDKAASYDPAQSLESWYMTVLKNVYLDWTRSWDRKHKASLDEPLDYEGLTLADTVADEREGALLDRLERTEDAERVHRALAGLAKESRAVLTMIDVNGMGYEEAARALDWPLGTVRSRLSRARAALRTRLLEMGVTA